MMQKIGRSDSNLRFSRQFAVGQILAVIGLSLIMTMTTVWISRQHDKLAEDGTRRMIEGGIAALDEKLRTTTLDYSLWTDAYEHIRARDADWIWTNIGSGAAETGTTDLMMIVEPGGVRRFGWQYGMGEEPAVDLVPAGILDDILDRLDSTPVDSAEAISRFARFGGDTWLLVAARVMPYDGASAGAVDADLPHHVFGFRVSGEHIRTLGENFLVDDLTVMPEPVPGKSSLRLGSGSESGGFAVWTPGHPGMVILKQIALPLLLGFGVIALASVLLSRHVVASAARLERAVEAAQAADRAKTEFLANVSHELRTPMNGVIGMSQVMQSMDLAPELREMVDVVLVSARSQMALIEDLLDIARIDSGARVLEHAPFDPVAALNEVRDIMALKADGKGIDLRIEAVTDEGVTVLGDKGCFKQILTNLIDNAIKFTDQGHVAVVLRSKAQHDEMRLQVDISDTGTGIDPKDHELIFERFGQVDGTLTRSAGGAGLGLAITRSLVELMAGTLGLRSELGKGASFIVDIPFELAVRQDARRAAA